MTAHVLALDLSCSQPGAARIPADRTQRIQHWHRPDPLPAQTDHHRAVRITAITAWVRGLLTVTTAAVAVEAPAHGVNMPGHGEVMGCWWAVRCLLARAVRPDGGAMPVGIYQGTSVKARVAGHGGASKEELRRVVARLYPGQGLDRAPHDVTDAIGVGTLAVARLAATWPDQWTGPWLDGRAIAPDAGQWEHLPKPPERPARGGAPGVMFAAPGGGR